LTFFVDRSLGRRIVPAALRGAGFAVVTHDEMFSDDTSDEEWLAEAGAHGWVVLMKDDRIRYNPRERAALEAAAVRAFVLAAGNITGEDQAWLLVARAEAITRFSERHPGPYVVGVYQVRPFLRPLYPPGLLRHRRATRRREGA
jgi:hypothetical protein